MAMTRVSDSEEQLTRSGSRFSLSAIERGALRIRQCKRTGKGHGKEI